jgi:hypothetical protein
MEEVVYRRKRSALSRSEREWRVEEHALVTRGGSGRERRFPWRDMVSVRLCHEPARLKPWRYVFELQPRHGRKIEIDNAHCLGPGEFEERSEAYTRFVRAALKRVAAENPKARALIGETPKRYFFLFIVALVVLGGLAFALIAVATPLDRLPYAPAIKLAIILLMLPIFWRWVIGAMPRGVPLDAVPERALPPMR